MLEERIGRKFGNSVLATILGVTERRTDDDDGQPSCPRTLVLRNMLNETRRKHDLMYGTICYNCWRN